MPVFQVLKFGGASLDTADALRRAATLVKHAAPDVAVVVSAGNDTADLLRAAVECALKGEEKEALERAQQFGNRQLQLIEQLISSPSTAEALGSAVRQEAIELAAICQSVRVLQELTERTKDAIRARAERAIARLLAHLLAQEHVAAEYVDATRWVATELRAGQLWPDFPKCELAAAAVIKPFLAKKVVVVTPGLLAAGPAGELVTLGAGGADFSATILAKSLGAHSVTLYKDIEGLMTADPHWVPEARVIPELHFREAAELAYYGARVLHPRALIPAMDGAISIFIKNISQPSSHGTRIAGDVKPRAYPVKALTAYLDQALVSVDGSGMIGVPGMAARTFGALSQAGHSVSMISQASSESSICFVVPDSEAEHCKSALETAFAPELKRRLVDSIQVQQQVAILAVIGIGMRGTPGIAARTFSALSRQKINILAIAQGSSELNITLAVRQRDASEALNALHREYQLDRIHALPEPEGRESNLVLLGFGQIGRALAQQMSDQAVYFERDLGINLKTIAVLDRSGLKLDATGFRPEALKSLVQLKNAGGKSPNAQLQRTPRHSQELLREKLWQLPLHQPILTDLTAAETAPLILEALEHGFHIVLANKKPLAIPQPEFDEMMESARRHSLSLRYEATVGAGLPVLDTLSKLKEAGDEVNLVEGCLSGTLGYLMTQLEQGLALSAAVAKAYQLGYTEPDPREDLSGMDVARKALILARTLGHKVDLEAIQVTALFPKELSDADPARFIKNLEQLDREYAEKHRKAIKAKRVLRYVAKISRGEIQVAMEPVPKTSPMARLHGTDNQIVLHTRRYSTNPLVITGPGAGAEVTAAGVLNDIVAIASGQDRRLTRHSFANLTKGRLAGASQ
jgi:aspartokinase/homoserine dehydrogenase 1